MYKQCLRFSCAGIEFEVLLFFKWYCGLECSIVAGFVLYVKYFVSFDKKVASHSSLTTGNLTTQFFVDF